MRKQGIHPCDCRPFGELNGHRDFKSRVISGYKTTEALKLAEEDALAGDVCARTERGRLMAFLPELRIGSLPRPDNNDLAVLRSWCDGFMRSGRPFLIVRLSRSIVRLYTVRRI